MINCASALSSFCKVAEREGAKRSKSCYLQTWLWGDEERKDVIRRGGQERQAEKEGKPWH